MKYIINKTIVFDSNKLMLCLYENNQIVTRLTKPATRLLLELLQNNRISIPRDDLLEKVWIAYGFTASNAGLNNYISELRKAFVSLGYDHELIITLPKQGFRFEADIDILESNIAVTELTLLADDNNLVNNENTEEEKAKPRTYNFLSSLRIKSIFIIVVFSIFITASFFIFKFTREDDVTYQKVSKIDNCDIYLIGNTFNKKEQLSRIDRVLKHEEVDCKNIPSDVFYLEDRLNKNTIRAELITVCSKTQDNHYDFCFNIKNQRNTSK